MNHNINIRKATILDLDQVSKLFNDYRIWYRKPGDLDGAIAFIRGRLEKDQSVIFVAEESHNLLGFVQLYPLFSSVRMRPLWLLNDLYVKPEHRNRNIGKRLMDRCKEMCKRSNAAGIMLETEKSNDIGNYLYPKEGFHLETEFNTYFWTNSRGKDEKSEV